MKRAVINRARYTALVLAFFTMAAVTTDAAYTQELQQSKSEKQKTLEQLNRQISISAAKRKSLEQEVRALRQDRTGISRALVSLAERTRKLEAGLDSVEAQLDILGSQELDIRQSLIGRRDTLSKVLAALQRMGRKPPPALLVRPNDALASVRSAVLLGAVIPELRAETGILIADLEELSRLRASIIAKKKQQANALNSLGEEDLRLSLLVDEKLKLEGQTRKALEEQQQKTRILVEKAGSLKQLLAALNARIADKELAANKARKAKNARLEEENRLVSAARKNATRNARKLDSRFGQNLSESRFKEAKGGLILPVTGVEVVAFGEKNSLGSASNGAMMATRANALVVSPFNARIAYAGPFRSYGQLLILDVGDKVHIVLAGMARLNVGTGQYVLAGEPVGKMGTRRIASIAPQDIASSRPMLYVEFRKDGKPFDPAPWWTDTSNKRSGNDS